jgi:hypothetical protein
MFKVTEEALVLKFDSLCEDSQDRVTSSLLGNNFLREKGTWHLIRVLTPTTDSTINKLAPLFQRTLTMLPLDGKRATNIVTSAFSSSRRPQRSCVEHWTCCAMLPPGASAREK